MKKLTALLVILPLLGMGQVIRPLTPQEVSLRLLPQYRILAFGPVKPVTLDDIQKAKKSEREAPTPKLTNADSVEVTFTTIPGLKAGDPEIPVRIYRSKFQTQKVPVFVWYHGGGFVQGTLNWDHQRCANIALRGKVTVISVDYRLAPEHIYPAGLNDCYAAVKWAVTHAGKLGADSTKVAVAGASAGAGLAGGVALMARDRKEPRISLQILEIPPCDLDTTRRSIVEFYHIPGLKGADIPVLMKIYLGKDYGDNVPEYALPGLAKEVSGLPPALVVTAGVDPLRDGGIAYADRLIKAGIPVEFHNYAGYAHGMALPGEDELIYRMINQYLYNHPK